MFLSKRTILKTLPTIAIILFGLTVPFISYSDFTSLFKNGARLTRVGDSTAVGNLSGKFMVNPSGSAVYDIPIAAPPGTAKMAPDLSLHYDSSGGNGILGMGFSLQGLTAVTRVPSNYAQNGLIHGVDFSSADRFALNGQQLVSIGGTYGADGTEYRTYIDSQARIISQGSAGNGPAGFVVQTKGGQTAWYGTTSDSQILAQGTSTVATWALAKIQDAAGNTISYHYIQDTPNGSYYPSEIDYTSNDTTSPKLLASNSVKFIYDSTSRPDPITNYVAGSLFKTTQRLTEIQTYQGSTLVSDYKITYETSPNTFRSRIINIQQCDGSGNCFRPLQFTWQTNEKGWVEAPQWKSPTPLATAINGRLADAGVRLLDVNGIGRPELLWASGDKDGNYSANTVVKGGAWKASDQGWVPDASLTPLLPLMSQSDGLFLSETMVPTGVEFGDVDGSGKQTLLQLFRSLHPGAYDNNFYQNQNGTWVKGQSINTTNPIFFDSDYQTLVGYHVIGFGEPAILADLLGDGRLSILYGGLPVPMADEDPDSLPETRKYDPTGWKNLPSYQSPRNFVGDAETPSSTGLQLVYLTNNGLPDLMVANDVERITWLNSGQLSNTPGASWVQDKNFSPPDDFRFVISPAPNTLVYQRDAGGRVTNLSGSGLSDLVMAFNGNHKNWINTGAGWIPGPSSLNPPTDIVHHSGDWTTPFYDDGVAFIDVNGSGLPAWLQCSGSSNSGKCQAWINQNGAWVPDNDPAAQNDAPPVQITDANGGDNGVRFVDLLGTGFQDIIINNGTQNDAWLNKAQTKPDVITNVQDALGDNLQIQYKPITDNSIYTKGSSATYPNMDMQAPIYVVSQTASDTDVTPTTLASIAKKISKLVNTNAVQHLTTYKYANAVFNHLGWGFLGFGSVTTTDQFTGLSATVTYSQDTAAHTAGMPTGAVTTKSDGTIINTQASTFSTKVFGDPSGAVNASWVFPYVSQTIETGFDFNTGTKMSTKTTNTVMDDYGNPTDISETDVDQMNGGTYTTETQNTYTNHPDTTWRLGELTQAVVIATSTPTTGAASKITRTSTFTYDPATGFLQTSTVEPDSSTNLLKKTYYRDGFGNITSTLIQGANMNDRTESVIYDPTDSFITSKTNALKQTTSYLVDPRFGVVTQTTDPNGLIESNILDGFGRVTSTTHPDKTVSSVSYQWASGDSAAPQGSVYEVILTQAGTPEKISYHDELDREIGQTMQGFVGNSGAAAPWIWQLTNYDELGRVVSKTLPFFAGTPSAQIYASSNQYDPLGRVILTTNADGTIVKQSYNGYSTTTTNPKNQSTTRTTNIRGNLIQTLDPEGHKTTYQYDAFNNLMQIIDSKGNTSAMTYDNLGHKLTMNDFDRGKSFYTYDALGEVLSQTDANQNTTTFKYDVVGRMLLRLDQSGASSAWQYDTAPNGIGKLASENGVSTISKTSSGSWRHPATPNAKNLDFKQQLEASLASPTANPVQAHPSYYQVTAPTPVQLLNAAKDNVSQYTKTFVYDDVGRLRATTLGMQGQNYITTTTYDENSRPDVVTYANKVAIQNHYDPYGYLAQVTDNTSGIAYSTVNTMDAAGHVISLTHSNGLITNSTYDPKTNFLTDIQTNPSTGLQLERQLLPQLAKQEEEKANGKDWKLTVKAKSTEDPNADQTGVAKVDALFKTPSTNKPNTLTLNNNAGPLHDTGSIQNLHYDYDSLGNVQDKNDKALNVQDNYQYDDLNRLTQDQTVDNAHGQSTALNYGYDELGNITSKSDVGNYTYNTNLGTYPGPHAVLSISGAGSNQENDTFQYDANGNQTQEIQKPLDGNGATITRNIAYTTFDVPKTITQSNDKTNVSSAVNFYYNADRKRFMRQDQVTTPTGGTTKTTTLYLDGMEIDTTIDPTGKITNQYKNYIGDSELITDDQGKTTRYDILKDNIGSTSVITDQNGNVTQRFHYDPFGEQQLVATTPPSALPRDGITKYGFTGQEEVAAGGIDLIHMNGRMYDPHLGRFLSADPLIQDPGNSQSLNRYTYCLNDPLAFTDPSGFSWWGHFWHGVGHLFDGAAHSIGALFRNQTFDAILEIAMAAVAIANPAGVFGAMSIFGRMGISAAFNGVISYAQTGSIGAGLETAAFTYASEVAWMGTGSLLQGANWGESTLVHGAVGGGLNMIQGGSFKNGFLAAASSQALAGEIAGIDEDDKGWGGIMARGMAAGVVGGTVAATTGGNFENGMMTSAFGQMFNDELHAYQDKYSSTAALQRALQGDGITFGVRGLDPDGKYLPMYNADSAQNDGFFHEEIFYDDPDGNLHSVGYFKGGMQYDTELSDDAISHYRFEPVQRYTVGPMISFYWQQENFRADNYDTFSHNCQDYAEHMRNTFGLNSYI